MAKSLRKWGLVCSLGLASACSFAQAQDLGLSSIEIQFQPLQPGKSAPVVSAIAASDDGRLIAAAGDDHAIRLITLGKDAEGQDAVRVSRTLPAHSDWIQTLAFSRDTRELYSGGDDGWVLRWSYTDQQIGREVVRLPFAVRSICVSTEQRLLAVAGFGEFVGVWDLSANKWKYQFTCPGGDQRCVKFSPSGSKLFSGGRNGVFRIWDLRDGKLLCNYQGHTGRIHTAAFSSDERMVTSVGEDRRLIKFGIDDQRVLVEREFPGVKLLSMSLINDHLVAAAGSDNSIRVLDLLADSEIGRLQGHSGSVSIMTTCGDLLVSGAYDTTLRIWDLPKALRSTNGPTRPVGKAPLKKDKLLDIR